MGLLKMFSKPASERRSKSSPPLSGSIAINRAGVIVASTLSSTLPQATLEQIGRTALHSFASARKLNTPLSELVTYLSEIKIVAVELRGGALVFLHPNQPSRATCTLPAMSNPTVDDFILYLETYIECWKQFNHYVNLARVKKFEMEDEIQFLEVKSLITQGLEVILATIEQGGPRKDEVMALINGAPSIRYLSEHENSIATVESQWHKAYLSMQSLLGRLKVQQQKQEGEWSWSSLFGRER